jgi:uncharacterized protein YacL
MNNELNTPDQIWLGKKDYSFWTDWKVNGWLFVATIISGLSDIVFRSAVMQWSLGARTLLAAVPFVLILLWVRALARWIKGMDELHRRITLAAVLFATSAAFFVVILWHRLNEAGLFSAAFPGGRPNASWDIATLGHIFLLLTFFYFLGHTIFNRRYR